MRRTSMLLALAIIQTACQSAPTVPEAEPPLAVQVETIREEQWPREEEVVGTVEARRRVSLASRVPGRVLRVAVEEGDRVRSGQWLVEIDARQARAGLERTQAALQEAREELSAVDSSKAAAASQVAAARARLRLAEATHRRFQRLLERQSASPQEYDRALAERDEARARALAARQSLEALEARARALAARIEEAQAGLRQARVALEDHTLRAPFDGTIVRKEVEKGQMVLPSTPLLQLERAGEYEVKASVDESRAVGLRSGQKVRVRLEALGVEFAAPIRRILPASDPASRSIQVKVALPWRAGLRSGLFARVWIPTGRARGVLVGWRDLVRRGQLTAVYLAGSDGRARYRLITLGRRVGERVEVLSGLKPGDRLIRHPHARLWDGRPISAVRKGGRP